MFFWSLLYWLSELSYELKSSDTLIIVDTNVAFLSFLSMQTEWSDWKLVWTTTALHILWLDQFQILYRETNYIINFWFTMWKYIKCSRHVHTNNIKYQIIVRHKLPMFHARESKSTIIFYSIVFAYELLFQITLEKKTMQRVLCSWKLYLSERLIREICNLHSKYSGNLWTRVFILCGIRLLGISDNSYRSTFWIVSRNWIQTIPQFCIYTHKNLINNLAGCWCVFGVEDYSPAKTSEIFIPTLKTV